MTRRTDYATCMFWIIKINKQSGWFSVLPKTAALCFLKQQNAAFYRMIFVRYLSDDICQLDSIIIHLCV